MIDWTLAAPAALAALVLAAAAGRFGGLAWWRRRGAPAQLALLVLLPALAIVLGVGASLLIGLSLEEAAGVLFGAGLGLLLPLLATSFLIQQIRDAFSAAPEDEPPHAP